MTLLEGRSGIQVGQFEMGGGKMSGAGLFGWVIRLSPLTTGGEIWLVDA